MLMLSLNVGDGRYALDGRYVVEVVPRVLCESIPQAPSFILGRMNYRGAPIPVLDLCQLVQKKACKSSLHTRIIVCSQEGAEDTPFLGILAERVTNTLEADAHEFLDLSISPASTPFLRGILHLPGGTTVQWLSLMDLYTYVAKAFHELGDKR